MLSYLLSPQKRRLQQDAFNSSSPYAPPDRAATREVRYAAADWTETENDDDDTEEDGREEVEVEHDQIDEEDEDEDGQDDDAEAIDDNEDGGSDTPLLPIFSAAHLGALRDILLSDLLADFT
jgi:hypothetical protein